MMLASNSTSTQSLGWCAPFTPKCIPLQPDQQEQDHNLSFKLEVSFSQIDAYRPGEDRLYVNEKDNLFGIFDGHGGDILIFLSSCLTIVVVTSSTFCRYLQ